MFDDDLPLSEALGINTPEKENKPSVKLITDDLVGVEVELEMARDIAMPRGSLWNRHEDGSLRNGGMEFTFRKPLNGIAVVTALDQLKTGVETSILNGSRPEKSARASVHVHVDCTDLRAEELIRFLLLYMIWEIPIFKTFAEARMGNHFCFPMRDCYDLLEAPRLLKQGWNAFTNVINNPNLQRYCALNPKALFKFGTLEFRHHAGEWEPEALLQWVNTCLSFKRACRVRLDIQESYFENSQKGFEGQLREIFPRSVAERVLDYYGRDHNEFNRDVIKGVRTAQHAVNPIAQ